MGAKRGVGRRELLKAMTGAAMLPMAMSAFASGRAPDVDADTVYELRIYHLNEGKLPHILERFKKAEVKIFTRLGMHPVGFWVPEDPPLAGRTLIYMLRHKSRDVANDAWKKFQTDPEWLVLKAESEKNGPFVSKRESIFMKLTEFSPKV